VHNRHQSRLLPLPLLCNRLLLLLLPCQLALQMLGGTQLGLAGSSTTCMCRNMVNTTVVD
jgi:hypothetical protein